MNLSLLILGPEGSVRWWPLRPGPIRVGRGKNNDLVIVGRGVSRNHAVLELEGDRLLVQDQDSTYGTKINGRQMRRASVALGDHIDIGVFRLVLAPLVTEPRRPTPPERAAIPNGRQEHITDPGVRGRWDEPTVGVVTTAELDLGVQEGSGWDLAANLASPTTSVPVIRRLRSGDTSPEADQPSDPYLGVRFVADPVTLDDALAASLDEKPVASAVEGLASGLRRDAAQYSSAQLKALDALLDAHAVIQQVGATQTLSAFLDQALAMLLSRLAADTVLLIQREQDGRLRVISAQHRHRDGADDLPVSRAIVDHAFSTGRPQQTSQFRSDPHVGRRPSVMAYRSGALLAVPLLLAEGCPGVVVLARRTGHPFDRTQVETVQAIAGLLGRSLQLRDLEIGGVQDRRRRALLERFHAPETTTWIYACDGHTARREERVTVLHAELPDVASTVLLQGPKQAATLLESLRGVVHQAVTGHGGTLLHLRDETALAVFGRGEDTSENDASWAVSASREMVREFRNLARHARLAPNLSFRIGLDRGDVLEALLGPTERLLHTVLGEPVLKARSAARAQQGTGIRATEEVIENLPGNASGAQRLAPEQSGLDFPIYEIAP